MVSLEITCIIKDDRSDPDKRIQVVGGVAFRYSQESAIRAIETGIHTFWTRGGGATSDVVVATSARGNKYLRTKANGVVADNLLSLPSC